jgi:hypothetical protein
MRQPAVVAIVGFFEDDDFLSFSFTTGVESKTRQQATAFKTSCHYESRSISQQSAEPIVFERMSDGVSP